MGQSLASSIKYTVVFLICIYPLQKSLKQEHFLWQLLNIQNDIEKANEDLDVEDNSLKEIVRELDTYEAEARKKSKEKAGYNKEIQQCQRRIAEKQNRLDKVRYLSWRLAFCMTIYSGLIFLDSPL